MVGLGWWGGGEEEGSPLLSTVEGILMAIVRRSDESEFGGAPGLIQPPPHPLTPAEQMRLERKVNPSDPEDSVEAASAREGNRLS